MSLLTVEQRREFEQWCREQELACARKKNGRWRNFWTEYGPDLLFVACVLGLVTALTAIYLALETLGWFNL